MRHNISERAAGPAAALLIVSLAGALLLQAPAVHAISVGQGDPAPEFTAPTIDGDPLSLSELKGRIVFIAFWSSWCSRCKEEMDYLKGLKTRFPQVTFLAINAEAEEPDEDAIGRMRQAITEWEVPFTVLIDRGLLIWDMYKVNALPTSFIVDPEGTIAFAEPNFYFASPENIENAMRRLAESGEPLTPTEAALSARTP